MAAEAQRDTLAAMLAAEQRAAAAAAAAADAAAATAQRTAAACAERAVASVGRALTAAQGALGWRTILSVLLNSAEKVRWFGGSPTWSAPRWPCAVVQRCIRVVSACSQGVNGA